MLNDYGLKACPFCGEMGRAQMVYGLEGQLNGVYCKTCHMLCNWGKLPTSGAKDPTIGETTEALRAAWNKRGGEP